MSVETVAKPLSGARLSPSECLSVDGDSEMTNPNRPNPSYIQPARSEA